MREPAVQSRARGAAELIAPEVASGRNVWFAGHWGLQWYAEKAGARPLTITRPNPVRGDLVVSSLRSLGSVSSERMRLFPQRKLLKTLVDDTPGGRVMDLSVGAGFFSNHWGYLPWAWGDKPIDQFDLWEIE